MDSPTSSSIAQLIITQGNFKNTLDPENFTIFKRYGSDCLFHRIT